MRPSVDYRCSMLACSLSHLSALQTSKTAGRRQLSRSPNLCCELHHLQPQHQLHAVARGHRRLESAIVFSRADCLDSRRRRDNPPRAHSAVIVFAGLLHLANLIFHDGLPAGVAHRGEQFRKVLHAQTGFGGDVALLLGKIRQPQHEGHLPRERMNTRFAVDRPTIVFPRRNDHVALQAGQRHYAAHLELAVGTHPNLLRLKAPGGGMLFLFKLSIPKLEYEQALAAVAGADLNMTTFRQTSTRAGRYVKQPTGYQSFVPAPLPPTPRITFDDAFLDVLSRADRAIGRLDGCAEVLPNSELFVFMYIRKEAVLSSQIEGTQASLMDVLEFEAATREAVPRDVGEVFNYVRAMDHGLGRLKTLPLSLRLIREIHAKLLSAVRGAKDAGYFRDKQNWIGPVGSLLKDAIFVPPAPQDMHHALDSLERFLHDKSPMPYLVRTGIAHAYFETIHPFVDGNGRVGRLLITFMLCEQRILRKPLLYLSFFLKKNRSEYYDRLQAVRDSGQWEQWLKFFLKGVAQVAEEATDTARRIVQLREQHRRSVSDTMGRSTGRAIVLLESLYRQPVLTLSQISTACGITFQGASDLAKHFESLNILKEITGQRRHRVFAYARYLALLGEPLSQRTRTVRSAKKGRSQRTLAGNPPISWPAVEAP